MINGVFVSSGQKAMLQMLKSQIITSKGEFVKMNKIAPVHPGEILMSEFLEPFKLSQNKLAHDIGVSPRRINEIVHGKRAVTANTALRLARYFRMSPQFWLGLQMDYELDLQQDELADKLDQEVKIFQDLKIAS